MDFEIETQWGVKIKLTHLGDIFTAVSKKINKPKNDICLALFLARELINIWYNRVVYFTSRLSDVSENEIFEFVNRRTFIPFFENYTGALNELEGYKGRRYSEKNKIDRLLEKYKETLYEEKTKWMRDTIPDKQYLKDWLTRLRDLKGQISGHITEILEDMQCNESSTRLLLNEYLKGFNSNSSTQVY